MFDIQQQFGRNHLSSSRPIDRRSNENCLRTRSKDFDFWAEQRTRDCDKYDNSCRGEVDFEAEEDEYVAYSPQLWRTGSFKHEAEASSLLPYDHHGSYPSPTSRLQAILDGRRELMEMIQDMPESCYELSLKDLVDGHHPTEGVELDDITSEKSLNANPEGQIKKTKKKKTRKGHISRSESMDSGVFLLKMFFPTPGLSKKSRRGNRSKVSPRPSTEWWKIPSLLVLRESKNKDGAKSRIGGSNSSSDKSDRTAENDYTPGCWSFNAKNCKTRRKQGCLF